MRFWFLLGLIFLGLLIRGGGHLMAWFLVGIFLFGFAAVHFFKQRERYAFSAAHVTGFLLLLVFAALTVISWVKSSTPAYGFEEIAWACAGLLVFTVLSEKRLSNAALERFFRLLTVLGIAVTLFGLWFYVFGPMERLSGLFFDPTKLYRTYPNAFANFLLFLIPAALYLWMRARGRLRMVYAGVVILFVSALFLTFSRAAFLVFLVGSFFFALLHRRQHSRAILVSVFLFIAGGLLALGLNEAKQQFTEPLSFIEKASFQAAEGISPISERAAFFHGSFLLMKERPLLGYGPGSFSFVYPQHQVELLANSEHPHNVFLKIGVESGIPALLVFSAFIVLLLITTVRAHPFLTHDRRQLFTVCVAAFFLALAHNIVDYNLLFTTNALLFFGFAGLLVNLGGATATSTVPTSRAITPVFLLLVSLALFFVTVHDAWYFFSLRAGRMHRDQGRFFQAHQAFLRADNMFFPRETAQLSAETALDIFRATNDRRWLTLGEEIVDRALDANPRMARLHALRGDIFLVGAQSFPAYEVAEESFHTAILLDPKNDLSFYEKFIRTLVLQGKFDEAKRLSTSLHALLRLYQRKLAHNEHLTVLSGNPYAAIGIAKLLQRIDPAHASEYMTIATSIDTLRTAELEKMQRRYF